MMDDYQTLTLQDEPRSHEGNAAGNTAVTASPSPKLRNGHIPLFRYYAGFSEEFVESMIRRYAGNEWRILDPWNGAGTTTSVASRLGFASTGSDINPCMNLVASARMQSRGVWESVRCAVPEVWAPVQSRTEALTKWFTPESAALIRGLERVMWMRLGGSTATFPYDAPSGPSSPTSAIAAAVAVAMTTRHLVQPFQTSNPTWIRLRVRPEERISLSMTSIRSTYVRVLDEVLKSTPQAAAMVRRCVQPHLVTTSSERLPVPDASFDLVVTSPPYCTRIDYVVATLPELATIGIPSWADVETLRHAMLGAPNSGTHVAGQDIAMFPEGVQQFLSKVRAHPSKASSAYYLSYYVSYFSRLAGSIREVCRVLRQGGIAVFVVQDSHYKEYVVSLANHVADLAQSLGLALVGKQPFHVPNPKALNPANKQYRKSSATIEWILTLTRR